jgi:phosphoglycolate phosphatase-like HAD superfamily hydrolase
MSTRLASLPPCLTRDPDEWFTKDAMGQHAAARRCRPCPERVDCLAEALDAGIEFGVWGGMTERERRALLRRRRHVGDWSELLHSAEQEHEHETARARKPQPAPVA